MRAVSLQMGCAVALSTVSITFHLLSVAAYWIAFTAKAFSRGTFAFRFATRFAFATFAFSKEDLFVLLIIEAGNQGEDTFSSEALAFPKSLSLAFSLGFEEHLFANKPSYTADWLPLVFTKSALGISSLGKENKMCFLY